MLQFDLNKLIEPITIANTNVDVLRLDKLDTAISGNKWFKLQYFLEDAVQKKALQINTYGGVWSNHIAACASACKLYNIPCKGYIRSDEALETPTIQKAKENGMQIEYCTREQYKQLKTKNGLDAAMHYYIPEGGATGLGIKGAAEVLKLNNLNDYTHIVCAVGTGTTFAGVVNAALPLQQVLGINCLKGGSFQLQDIEGYLEKNNYTINNAFHFGGFAKYDTTLLEFMNTLYTNYKIPTDVVYTAKMFYAVQSLLQENYFATTTKLLIIHSGGLQGNLSLTEDKLIF